MKIGELAARASLNASAIRYYEKMGVLVAPVLLVRFATNMGFTLAEIKLFLSGLRDNTPVGPRWKKLAARKLAEVEQNIARSLKLKSLLQGLLRCHCPSLQFCVNRLSFSENLRLPQNFRR